MAYVHIAPRGLDLSGERPRIGSGRVRSLFGRLFRSVLEAIERSNQRRADQQIAQYLGRSKGKFTDELEREIERRFLSNPR